MVGIAIIYLIFTYFSSVAVLLDKKAENLWSKLP